MARLTPEQERLFAPPNLAYLATLMPDGSPHVSPLWADVKEGLILLNTAEGRIKLANARRDPRVGVSIHDRDRPHPPVAIRGSVVEFTEAGAAEHIDDLARRYTGEPWEPVAGQTRVIMVIRPDHVLGWT